MHGLRCAAHVHITRLLLRSLCGLLLSVERRLLLQQIMAIAWLTVCCAVLAVAPCAGRYSGTVSSARQYGPKWGEGDTVGEARKCTERAAAVHADCAAGMHEPWCLGG